MQFVVILGVGFLIGKVWSLKECVESIAYQNRTAMNNLQASIAALQENVQGLGNNLDVTLTSLTTERDALRAKAAEVQTAFANLQAEYAADEIQDNAAMQALNDQLAGLQAQINDTATLKAIQTINDEVDGLNSRLNAANLNANVPGAGGTPVSFNGAGSIKGADEDGGRSDEQKATDEASKETVVTRPEGSTPDLQKPSEITSPDHGKTTTEDPDGDGVKENGEQEKAANAEGSEVEDRANLDDEEKANAGPRADHTPNTSGDEIPETYDTKPSEEKAEGTKDDSEVESKPKVKKNKGAIVNDVLGEDNLD